MDRRRSETDQAAMARETLLKEHIKGRLRQFVESSPEFRSATNFNDGTESRKQEIVDRLRSSENFQRWKTEVLRSEIEMISATADSSRNLSRALLDTHDSAAYSIENFGSQSMSTFPSYDSQNDDDDECQQPLNSGISFALTGTMSASTFAFMGRNYLKHVVDVLMASAASTDEDFTVKYDTLQALTQLPASDMCESEHWSDFKLALRRLLDNGGDEQQRRLCDAVLGFLVKLFNASNHNVTVDAFSVLADHLIDDVFGSKRTAFRVKDGRRLEFEEYGDVIVLQKLRILDEMCLGFAKVLPRYSQQHMSMVAEKMVTLLDTSVATEKDEDSLTPFLAWSILDPKMKWWRSWMHGRLGRTAILLELEKRWPVVEFLLNTVLDSPKANTPEKSTETQLDILQVAAASYMVESLLLYEESRLLLGKRFSNFPDDILDRLLKNAVEGGQRNKFAWHICFSLATNAHGRALFLAENRLRRIGTQLLSKDRKYHVKIKLLNLVTELLKSDDLTMESTSKILKQPLEYRDGKTSFCQLIMNSISDSIVAAYSRDPDAPLSLVYACFDTCTILCRIHSGRRFVSEFEEFLRYAIKLVKEHSVEVSSLLPILASVSLANPDSDFAVKKFLASNSICGAKVDSGMQYSPILWHRPMEFNDSVGSTFSNRLKDLQSTILRIEDLEERKRLLDSFLLQLFPVLCHPDGAKVLLNDTFIQTLLAPLRAEENPEKASINVSLKILDLALCRTDFLFGLRRRCDIVNEIATLLTKYFCFEPSDEAQSSQDAADGPSTFWIQSDLSTKLVAIYSKLRYLGGPTERVALTAESKLTTLNEILNDPSKCFSSEPSRFIVRPVTTGSTSTVDRSEGESLLNFFVNSVERKRRIQYSEILSEAVKDFRPPDQDQNIVSSSASEEWKDFETILEYGRNLNILDYDTALTGVSSFRQKIRDLLKSSDTENEIDWFGGVIYLIFGGRPEKAVEFLQKFAQCERTAVNCAWPKISPGSDFATIVNKEIVLLVDSILEIELPRVIAAFTMHGITASNVVIFWLNQCFVNVLDWPEICNYVSLAVIGGRRYQAFFCCCLCYQIFEEICVRAHDQREDCDLHSFLLGPISFKLHKCVSFLSYLSDKYI